MEGWPEAIEGIIDEAIDDIIDEVIEDMAIELELELELDPSSGQYRPVMASSPKKHWKKIPLYPQTPPGQPICRQSVVAGNEEFMRQT